MNGLKPAARDRILSIVHDVVAFIFALACIALAGTLLSPAHAQQINCMPYVPNSEWVWDELTMPATRAGVCIRWRCTKVGAPLSQWATYCGLWSEAPKVGGRMQTIAKAADPLKSLNDAPKRFTILPLSDPMFDVLRAEAFK